MAEETRHSNCHRYFCLFVACIVVMVSGSTRSFPIFLSHLKKEFQLEQKAGIQFIWEKHEQLMHA